MQAGCDGKLVGDAAQGYVGAWFGESDAKIGSRFEALHAGDDLPQ